MPTSLLNAKAAGHMVAHLAVGDWIQTHGVELHRPRYRLLRTILKRTNSLVKKSAFDLIDGF